MSFLNKKGLTKFYWLSVILTILAWIGLLLGSIFYEEQIMNSKSNLIELGIIIGVLTTAGILLYSLGLAVFVVKIKRKLKRRKKK